MSIPESDAPGRRVLKENDKETYYGERYLQDSDDTGDADTADSDSDDNSDTTASTEPEDEPVYAEESYTIDPANKRLLISRLGHSGGFRKVTATTEWINMKAGQLYYMEGHLLQSTAGLYYSIGVEIDPVNDTMITEPEHP